MSKRKLDIDYSQPIFFAEQLMQNEYDREIDEGLSSGLRRYATLDVTCLSEKQVAGVLEKLITEVDNFNVCKVVQVAGFNKDNKRYLVVSGESHTLFQKEARDLMLNRIRNATKELPSIKYIDDYVEPPEEGEPYQPINLGPYGSTGNPNLGIPQHPDAHRLRNQGKIRK